MNIFYQNQKNKAYKNWILKNNPSVYSKIYKVLAYDINEIINPIKKFHAQL